VAYLSQGRCGWCRHDVVHSNPWYRSTDMVHSNPCYRSTDMVHSNPCYRSTDMVHSNPCYRSTDMVHSNPCYRSTDITSSILTSFTAPPPLPPWESAPSRSPIFQYQTLDTNLKSHTIHMKQITVHLTGQMGLTV
jgi:hypothetical protein